MREGEEPVRYRDPENGYGGETGDIPDKLDWNEVTELHCERCEDLGRWMEYGRVSSVSTTVCVWLRGAEPLTRCCPHGRDGPAAV